MLGWRLIVGFTLGVWLTYGAAGYYTWTVLH